MSCANYNPTKKTGHLSKDDLAFMHLVLKHLSISLSASSGGSFYRSLPSQLTTSAKFSWKQTSFHSYLMILRNVEIVTVWGQNINDWSKKGHIWSDK